MCWWPSGLSTLIPGAQTYRVKVKRMSCSVLLRPSGFSLHCMQKRLHKPIIVLYFILLQSLKIYDK